MNPHKLTGSMSCLGSCLDNALAERAEIFNTKGLAQDALQLQVNTLRGAHSEASEQMKAKVFEKRSEA
jgi:hypothetical protein